LTENAHLQEFNRFMGIIAALRGANGCPWDRAQTHLSLREYLLQECFEVLEALDENDSQKLCGELGDLLLQIMLHTQIAAENGEFEMKDVIRGINEKMIRRHPHVFGTTQAATAEEVSHNWELIKKSERKNTESGKPVDSILDSVPRSMPSLAYSKEIQRRAAEAGVDWKSIDGVIEKVAEEVKELQETENLEQRSEEFGDLFFTLVNTARRMDVDPESALRSANLKFYKRFKYMEKLCEERNLEFKDLSFDEQNLLWKDAKEAVNDNNSVNL
jgi:tetrapyrrole methylase family protein / MazG family protein